MTQPKQEDHTAQTIERYIANGANTVRTNTKMNNSTEEPILKSPETDHPLNYQSDHILANGQWAYDTPPTDDSTEWMVDSGTTDLDESEHCSHPTGSPV
jgi:hypothetical protein